MNIVINVNIVVIIIIIIAPSRMHVIMITVRALYRATYDENTHDRINDVN